MAHSIKYLFNLLRKLGLFVALFSLPMQVAWANNALVIRGASSAFEEVVNGMNDDLEGEVTLHEIIVTKKSSQKEIVKAFKQHNPDIVILVGNKAVNLYGQFQNKNPKDSYPPAIAMAALFVDKFVGKLKNATAIRYEIPAVTSVVAMRSILGKPVKKVGVVYREWMEDIIKENQRYCKTEGIELVGIKLPNKSGKVDSKVRDALKSLSNDVDALWILNDNALLTRDALLKAWLPSRGKSKLPAIVGIRQFMTKIPLGSFAIVPDNYGLGAQAAGMIFDAMDNDWELEETDVQQPVSVKKFINVATLSKKSIGYRTDKLSQVDEVVK
ncbi:ABC transporter substrate binding protein [Pleionea sp. CnH1-48]|uniref:ABC transporter substrate binding protein n=1 Tax=Pleionea sp. CnH1-48 TaxID=2954494 RepID=UPI00209753B4|nr:ABC transporter substrate binding protein [Pleionea sp. CnH1-48]MCO7223729.1 hypothetical protein [Pleionea sp. CnH1-48]